MAGRGTEVAEQCFGVGLSTRGCSWIGSLEPIKFFYLCYRSKSELIGETLGDAFVSQKIITSTDPAAKESLHSLQISSYG